MKKRYLFAEVQNFFLYDFYAPEGYVNENVFAYSNHFGDERALVVYNNKFEYAKGWIRNSCSYLEKSTVNDEQHLVQKSLGDGLTLHYDDQYFCIFRDHLSGLEFIRSSKDLFDRGLLVELGAFKYHVFLNFREVQDNVWHHYAQLNVYLDGRGVPSIEDALKEIFLRPIHQSFAAVMNAGLLRRLLSSRVTIEQPTLDTALLSEINQKYLYFLREVKHFASAAGEENKIAAKVHDKLMAALQLDDRLQLLAKTGVRGCKSAVSFVQTNLVYDSYTWGVLSGWIFIHCLGGLVTTEDCAAQSRSWIDEWLLSKIILPVFTDFGQDEAKSWQGMLLIKILVTHQHWFNENGSPKRWAYRILKQLLEDQEVQQFLQVNRYQDVLWFNQEAFTALNQWLMMLAALDCMVAPALTDAERATTLANRYRIFRTWQKAEKESGYRVEKLLTALKQ